MHFGAMGLDMTPADGIILIHACGALDARRARNHLCRLEMMLARTSRHARCPKGTHLAGSSALFLQDLTMADKKKPVVKELPTKAVPAKDSSRVKGGRKMYE
jgi:hypothetical protein